MDLPDRIAPDTPSPGVGGMGGAFLLANAGRRRHEGMRSRRAAWWRDGAAAWLQGSSGCGSSRTAGSIGVFMARP